jgi:hypothetical protein
MTQSPKIGQASEPGEYDEGMLALLQLIWGDGSLSPGVSIPEKQALFADILRVLRPGAGSSQATGCAVAPAPIQYFRLEGIAYNMVTLEESAAARRSPRGELRPGHLKAEKARPT